MTRRDSVRRDWDESDVRVRPSKTGSRPRTKERPAHEDAVTGRIVTVDRGRYTAILEEDTPGERLVVAVRARELRRRPVVAGDRSEEHTSELQSLGKSRMPSSA